MATPVPSGLPVPPADKVAAAKVLVVGAGGIGCELLKDLVLSGFRNIEIIDLDTIDVSNLNRQFLFRREHVGRPKAEVARESVLRVAPDIQIVAHHASVFEERFGVSWVRGFDLVLNALDNIKARKHMNRLCMATSKPLLDSGTGGYSGQSAVHIKDMYECYDCNPPPPPKTFPVCTIRDTPDKIEHCVAWAKYFFELLFGKDDDTNMLQDLANPKEGEETNASSASGSDRQSLRWAADGTETSTGYAWRIFAKCFCTDIQKKAALMDGKETTRKPPQAVTGFTLADAEAVQPHDGTNTRTIAESQTKLSLQESLNVFLGCVRGMVERRVEELGSASFDKDDELAMDFVLGAANLRAWAYHIPEESHFKIKEVAGSIIPAIATTNAIAAGLMVIEAFKVLDGQLDKCKKTFISDRPDRALTTVNIDGPKPGCPVCNSSKPLECHVDTNQMTLGGFVDKVLKGHIGFNKPCVMTDNGTGIYDEEDLEDDDDMQENLGKAMSDFHLKHDTIVTIDDDSQALKVQIIIVHKESPADSADGPSQDADKFELVGSVEAPAAADDDEDDEVAEQASKRAKVAVPEEDNEGCICIS